MKILPFLFFYMESSELYWGDFRYGITLGYG